MFYLFSGIYGPDFSRGGRVSSLERNLRAYESVRIYRLYLAIYQVSVHIAVFISFLYVVFALSLNFL